MSSCGNHWVHAHYHNLRVKVTPLHRSYSMFPCCIIFCVKTLIISSCGNHWAQAHYHNLRVAFIVITNLRLNVYRLFQTKLGGVLPKFTFRVQFLFCIKPNWGESCSNFKIGCAQVNPCLKKSNRVLVTKRRSVSLSAAISLVRFRHERRFNSCLSTLECYDRISACEIHVKRSGERGADK